MIPCKCGDYCHMESFDDCNGGQVYGVSCNNPDCEEWPMIELQAKESEAVRLWNEWVES